MEIKEYLRDGRWGWECSVNQDNLNWLESIAAEIGYKLYLVKDDRTDRVELEMCVNQTSQMARGKARQLDIDLDWYLGVSPTIFKADRKTRYPHTHFIVYVTLPTFALPFYQFAQPSKTIIHQSFGYWDVANHVALNPNTAVSFAAKRLVKLLKEMVEVWKQHMKLYHESSADLRYKIRCTRIFETILRAKGLKTKNQLNVNLSSMSVIAIDGKGKIDVEVGSYKTSLLYTLIDNVKSDSDDITMADVPFISLLNGLETFTTPGGEYEKGGIISLYED